jgi:hypothetical protein
MKDVMKTNVKSGHYFAIGDNELIVHDASKDEAFISIEMLPHWLVALSEVHTFDNTTKGYIHERELVLTCVENRQNGS